MQEEKELLSRAALVAFAFYLEHYKDYSPADKVASQSWKAARAFVRAGKENAASQYEDVLNEYEGLEALRRVLELAGNTGRCLDTLVSHYAGKDDPLRAYAEEPPENPSRLAVMRYLSKK